jgi:hypothetical protein
MINPYLPCANSNYSGAGLASHFVAGGPGVRRGMAGYSPVQDIYQKPTSPAQEPPAKPKSKKLGPWKILFYTVAAGGAALVAFKYGSPTKFAQLAETIQKNTPTQVGEAKTYLVNYGNKLKQGSVISTALEKAEPLLNRIKSLWKK